ncbi:MAG: hypothetical protein KGI51_08935 [Rhodospirillales bacterium]|nr:hypothetical protein [Rhodospirillales bacterium]
MNLIRRWQEEFVGAALLAIGRARGIAAMPADASGAARSFAAAGFGLLPFAAQLALGPRLGGPPLSLQAVSLDLLAYAIGWAGYAVISHHLVATLGKADRWPRCIAAWNWVNVVQYLVLLAASLPVLAGLGPVPLQLLGAAGQLWALWMEWFAIRQALDATALEAAGLVLPDVLLGLALALALSALGAG